MQIAAGVPSTEYLDFGADPGRRWYYAVIAVDSSANESRRSEEAAGRR